MKTLIACCGLDCENCDARIATLRNDDGLREQTARKWREMNGVSEITAATIDCTGCRTAGVKFAYCSRYCQIRKCAADKGFATCGECADMERCEIVGAVFRPPPGAKKNLRQ